MDQFERDIIEWAEKRGIFELASPQTQFRKTLEEMNELYEALLLEDLDELQDAIGNIIITLIIQARMQGLDVMECCNAAWGRLMVKDRQGEMVDGIFVKNE